MKNKTTQGLGNKNLLSFPKHDSLKYWRLKSNVNSHMSIQYINQSESLSWSFSDLSGGKWCLQRKYMCRQHETLDCTKLYNQTRVTSEWYPFVKFLAGVGIHFLLDIWGWVKLVWLFNGWISKIFTKKTFLFGATPRHK